MCKILHMCMTVMQTLVAPLLYGEFPWIAPTLQTIWAFSTSKVSQKCSGLNGILCFRTIHMGPCRACGFRVGCDLEPSSDGQKRA